MAGALLAMTANTFSIKVQDLEFEIADEDRDAILRILVAFEYKAEH